MAELEDRVATDEYDHLLYSIMNNEGELLKFLDVIFSFLYRRTDFYCVLNSPDDKMGFPKGMVEKLTLAVFRKYEALSEKGFEGPAIVGKEEEVVTSGGGDQDTEKGKELKDDAMKWMEKREPEPKVPQEPEVPIDAQEDDPELAEAKKIQKRFQAQPDSYNGAIRENYSWSQSITECEVRVPVSSNVASARDVKVDIKHKYLTVKVREGSDWITKVDGELCWKVNLEKSFWNFVKGEHVYINLEKVQERWWDAILTDEEKINTRAIEACRPIEDLGEAEQAKIQELMFNEHQKRLGLPTIDQMKIQNVLKDAWNKEGSPFKGTQFDPTKINISTGSDFSNFPK